MSDQPEKPRREFPTDPTLSLTRFADMGELEETVEGNGEDIRSIRKLLEEQAKAQTRDHESHEGFKRGYAEDRKEDALWRLEMAKTLGELAGSQKATHFWAKVLVGLATAALMALVALVALAVKH